MKPYNEEVLVKKSSDDLFGKLLLPGSIANDWGRLSIRNPLELLKVSTDPQTFLVKKHSLSYYFQVVE